MKIKKTQVLQGPNIWSNDKNRLIQVKVDFQEIRNLSADQITYITERVKSFLTEKMEDNELRDISENFIEPIDTAERLADTFKKIALKIQRLAGMAVDYGQTKATIEDGVYNVIFAFEVEQAGLYAAEATLRFIGAMTAQENYDAMVDINELALLKRNYTLGPSTLSIVEEAEKRGIPWLRLEQNSKIQLGYGINQKKIRATITCNTSDIAVAIAGDKDTTKKLLASAGVPVPKGGICTSEEELKEIIEEIGLPIVIKPLDGNQGKGATIGIKTFEEAQSALEEANKFCRYAIVEKYIEGNDFRLLVIDGKLVAAAKRIPAHIIGNGTSTVRELIDEVNKNPARGEGHEAPLTKIKFDNDTYIQLRKNFFSIESIPAENKIVYLKSTANISTGGTSHDMTDEVHPENKFMAERIAKIIGLDICGIDMITTDISQPIRTIGGAVLEVNAAPGFRMHLEPTLGKPRNVAKSVIDMLFPADTLSTIPIISVTGTNGKTTTTRLLAHIAKVATYNPGYTTTDGIYIGDYKIVDGDTTGPLSAAFVLRDPTVDFAVLETARGGILRSGLFFNKCDIGIITNIEEDHLGLNDIETIDDLAKVKAVVAKSVKKTGWAVLNAEDENCILIAAQLECNYAFFSMNEQNKNIQQLVRSGGRVAVFEDNNITIIDGKERLRIAHVSQIPLTENGKCHFMIANVLAATLAAYCWGFTKEHIQKALLSFNPSYEQTPGRMNLFEFKEFKVLVDYAHNPHGLMAMKDYLSHITAKRKIGIIAGIGDRRDEDTRQLGSIAAGIFDHIIIRQEHSLRGRTIEEINNLVIQGIKSVNKNITYDLIPDETEAIKHALTKAMPGDFIVALSDVYKNVVECIRMHLQAETTMLKNETIAT